MSIRPFPSVRSGPAEPDDGDIPFQYAVRAPASARPVVSTCAETPVVMRELADTPARLASARRFVEQCACRTHGQTAVPVVSLLLSELVASTHATGPVTVRIECQVTELKIDVTCASWREAVPDADDRLRVLLIAKIARLWGVRRDGHKRTSWATVPTGSLPRVTEEVSP